jgi:hypothetical protein
MIPQSLSFDQQLSQTSSNITSVKMGASASIPEVRSTPNLTLAAVPPIDPLFQDSVLLTERQKRRRTEKAIVERGFEGNIIINPDPHEATRHAQLEYLNPSHWGDKESRMVFWAKGCCIVEAGLDVTSGIGVVSQTSPDPDQWVWGAYHVVDEVDTQMVKILAVAMALRVAKDECDKLAETERPSKVVIYSSSREALMRIHGSNFITLSGVRMVKAGVRVAKDGLVAEHFLNKLGIGEELEWIPDGCEIDGAHESARAATEGAKYKPPPKGPDAFIKDVQADYKRKQKVRRRRQEAKQRKREAK